MQERTHDAEPAMEQSTKSAPLASSRNVGYVPVEMRQDGFKESVLEWLELQELRILAHPEAEELSDKAIEVGLTAAGVKGWPRRIARFALDRILPEMGVKLLFQAVRYLIKALP